MPPRPRGSSRCGRKKYSSHHALNFGIVPRVVPVAGGLEGGVEVGRIRQRLRASSSRIGVRSPPPPNQSLVVTRKRVLKCAAGTRGLRICATREMPVAKKRGSASAPGICVRNSGENSPMTVETLTPTFSKTRPRISPSRRRRRPRAASRRCATNRPGGSRLRAEPASSIASKAAQRRSRSASNQARARAGSAVRAAAGQRIAASGLAPLAHRTVAGRGGVLQRCGTRP